MPGERWFSLLLALGGAGIMGVSLGYGREGGLLTSPGSLPFVVGVGIVALAGWDLVSSVLSAGRCHEPPEQPSTPQGETAEPEDTGRLLTVSQRLTNLLKAAGLFTLYVAAIGPLGYMISTAMFVPLYVLVLYRANWKAGITCGILVAIACHYLFTLLGVRMPRGFLPL